MKTCNLTFGTAGIRAVMGNSSTELNFATIEAITHALICTLQKQNLVGSVVITYDSRNHSVEFSQHTANIFADCGYDVYLSQHCESTPFLSYCVRKLECVCGVNMTASHNPKEYNGYKVYNHFGAQIDIDFAEMVQSYLKVCHMAQPAQTKGKIRPIPQSVHDAYIDCVFQSTSFAEVDISNLQVVYTPLHGVGAEKIQRVFERANLHAHYVANQMAPDGDFPTTRKPNPEEKDAFAHALTLAQAKQAEIILATDPDADRLGVMVLHNGKYELLSGNMTGLVLLSFLLSAMQEANMNLTNKFVVKSIVSSSLAEEICNHYGVKLINVLIGFRYIGEQIELDEDNYLFGFEESGGYLAGTHARDKDAIEAAYIALKAAAYYKQQGKTLIDVINDLYKQFGYVCDFNKTLSMEPSAIADFMDRLRSNPPTHLGHDAIVTFDDFNRRDDALKSNIILMRTSAYQIIIRPSGTEPKLKLYISAKDASAQQALSIAQGAYQALLTLLGLPIEE